jgi:hypothetical protein
LLISTLFVIVRYVFNAKDAKDVGKYFGLDNIPKDAYLFSDEEYTKTYTCKSRNENWG